MYALHFYNTWIILNISLDVQYLKHCISQLIKK